MGDASSIMEGYEPSMAIRKIAQLGHPVLRTPCEAIPPEMISSPQVQGLIRDMVETMVDADGAGLAAPQVHESVRLVICTLEEGPAVFINPTITPIGDEVSGSWEGCLSITGLRGEVERYEHIHLHGWDHEGQEFEVELHGFDAVVTQHECDHLDGVLYIDRCDSRKLAFLTEYSRYHAAPPEEWDEE